jgi:hypothetical protein
MTNPTSNYSWQMPESTDLVTNLPADFEVFGQAVDSTVFANAAAAISATIVDAKGDLIAATAADAVSRIAIGANDTVLTADSAAATGMKWAAAAATSDYVLIARTTFSNVATQAFDSVFSATYGSYEIVIENIYSTSNIADLEFQFRYAGPTTQATDYYYTSQDYNAANTATSLGTLNDTKMILCGFTGIVDYGATANIQVNQVGNGSKIPTIRWGVVEINDNRYAFGGGEPNTAREYTGFLLKASTTNITGSVAIYGRK